MTVDFERPALAAGMDYVDLNFRGHQQIIATAILHGSAGVALIDPGPSSTLAALGDGLRRLGLTASEIRAILLTHIHLDHAGATGTLVRENPSIEVFVQTRGAEHLIDPSRLLDSASRLYGAEMYALWGEVLPVPSSSVRTLAGGEGVEAAGRQLEVAYTPGHAWHHVSYFERASGVAFVGDTAGIRRGESGYVLPPAPPPDIDLEAWRASIDRILTWEPETLFLTHFGPVGDPRPHFDSLLERLDDWSQRVRASLTRHTGPEGAAPEGAVNDAARAAEFSQQVRMDLRRAMPEDEAARYELAGRFDYSWQGLARYWRKQEV